MRGPVRHGQVQLREAAFCSNILEQECKAHNRHFAEKRWTCRKSRYGATYTLFAPSEVRPELQRGGGCICNMTCCHWSNCSTVHKPFRATQYFFWQRDAFRNSMIMICRGKANLSLFVIQFSTKSQQLKTKSVLAQLERAGDPNSLGILHACSCKRTEWNMISKVETRHIGIHTWWKRHDAPYWTAILG